MKNISWIELMAAECQKKLGWRQQKAAKVVGTKKKQLEGNFATN